MKVTLITAGDHIDTTTGYFEIKGGDYGGIVYVDEYLIDEAGNEELWESTHDIPMTTEEIEAYMREADGRNHKVIYVE